MRKSVKLLIAVSFLVTSHFFLSFLVTNPQIGNYDPNLRGNTTRIKSTTQAINPLNFTSNQDFMDWCTVGDGSSGNPFIIEFKEIEAIGTGENFCININNTNAHFIIRNCNLSECFRGLWLNNVSNAKIEEVYVENFSYAFSFTNCSKIKVSESYTYGGHGGVILESSSEVEILDNSFNRSSGSCIFLDRSKNNIISYNNITSCSDIGINVLFSSHDNLFDHNYVYDSYGIGINVDHSNGNVISRCNVTESRKCGICLINASNSEVTDNFVTKNCLAGGNCYAGIGIWDGSDYSLINENEVMGNTFTGILSGSKYVTIKDNSISENGREGIHVGFTSHNEIRNNIILNNTAGVIFQSVSDSIIADNTITTNTGYGIELGPLSKNNEITGNVLTGNKGPGIALPLDNDYNTISNGNVVTNNTIDNTEDSRTVVSDIPWISGFLILISLILPSVRLIIQKRRSEI